MADKLRIIHLSGDDAEDKAKTLLDGGSITTPDGGTGTMTENDVLTLPDKTDERLDNHETRISAVESAVGGIAATVEIGTVTTGEPGSEVKVENVGTPTAAVLNFTIPQGLTGADGVIRNLATGEEFKFFIGTNEEWTAYTGDKTNVLFFPTDEKSLYEHEVSMTIFESDNVDGTFSTSVSSGSGSARIGVRFTSDKPTYASYSELFMDYIAWCAKACSASAADMEHADYTYLPAWGYIRNESSTTDDLAGYYPVVCANAVDGISDVFNSYYVKLTGCNGGNVGFVYLHGNIVTYNFHCHSTRIR